MRQVIYTPEAEEPRYLYELTFKEFDAVLKGMELYGDIVKRALITANDVRQASRPRVKPMKHALDILTDVLGADELEASGVELSDLDLLRQEWSEIFLATRSNNNALQRSKGTVLLGLFTTATIFNELRNPVLQNHPFEGFDIVRDMSNQFHAEGVERIAGKV